MTTDDLRTRAREAAERIYPREHVGYKKPPPEGCGCNECYVSESQRLAYAAGYLDHAAQQPTREDIARAIAESDDQPDLTGDQAVHHYGHVALAVLAMLDGAGS